MAFKLLEMAQKRWRKINGRLLLADVHDEEVTYVDGVKFEASAASS